MLKWLSDLIASEPVAFWTGFVGVGMSAAEEYGLPLQPELKHLIALATLAVCIFVARSKATSTTKPPPVNIGNGPNP